ncbi:MAG: diguanylate cyclase [Clostridiales bacterium]|jgi:predicted Fe-Mo cluster-binding NifX family protein|nr:diguanylate cyclase [Clostridiales bacterium]
MPLHRVALASADGNEVDLHFGRAESYLIADVGDDRINTIETRNVISPFRRGRGHSEEGFDSVLCKLSDCEAIVVAKIGHGAAQYVMRKGIRVFSAPGKVSDVLEVIRAEKLLKSTAIS